MFSRNIIHFRSSFLRELNKFSGFNNSIVVSSATECYSAITVLLNATTINGNNTNQQLQTQQIRYYAKNKDKKKEKSKKAPGKIEINESLLSNASINLDTLNNQMQRVVDQMKEEFINNLSLRSTSGAIETLKVNVDGQEHELQELAQISRKNPKTIIVNMIAFPQTIPDVLKAIEKSGMNLNPQQDGTTLFIPIPKVTKEHRENLSKNAKALFIKCRDGIKDVQNNAIKKVKKQTAAEISKDDIFNIQTQITAISDKFISEAEKILTAKQNELVGTKD